MTATDSAASAGEAPALSRKPRVTDTAVRVFVTSCGAFVVGATALVLAFIARTGVKGIGAVGLWPLLSGDAWKPEAGAFGGWPLIVGTLASSLGALFLGALPAVFTALWLVEFAPKPARSPYRRAMEIAAAVPSVVYGWLALVYLVPIVEKVAHALYGEEAQVGGDGLASAAVLLAVMIMPTVILLSVDALARVPQAQRDASAALGASPWQTALRVSLPHAGRGLLVAVFFGFARAAGETMAVQMVIGGARRLPRNLFDATTTISAQIVMDMQNARPGTTENDVLFSMALVLLVLSVTVVLATRLLTRRRPA